MWRKFSVTLVAGLTLVVAGCASTSTTTKEKPTPATTGVTSGLSGKTVDFIIYATPSTPFFTPVINGAEAAAKIFGLTLHVEFSNSSTTTQNNQIETAIASHVAGLAVSIPDNTGFTKSICDAQSSGIPVVTFNITATSGPVLKCTLAFTGQDFVSAGETLGKLMIHKGLIPHGAQVFCPVEAPTAVYAVGRAQGVQDALNAIGAKCNVVGTGFTLSKAQTIMTQYLLGHPNTKAIVALGEVPLQVGPAAAKAAGLSSLPIAGFDLSPQIASSIESGRTTATIEQQPWMQGFYPVEELALYMKYGLVPGNIDSGELVVDRSNVRSVAKLAGTVF